MRLRWGLLLFVFLLAGILFYISIIRVSPKATVVSQEPLIDEAMENVRVQQFDENGQLTQVLAVQKAFHHKNEKQMHLMRPDLTLFQNEATWHIAAKSGQALSEQAGGHFHQIDLIDDVKLFGSEQNKTWYLTTQLLHIYPDKKLASTALAVQLEGEGYTLNAKGMRIHLEQKQVDFLSDVKTQYKNVAKTKRDV